MFCPKCGTELPEGVTFCEKCGSGVTQSNNVEEKTKRTAWIIAQLVLVAVLLAVTAYFLVFNGQGKKTAVETPETYEEVDEKKDEAVEKIEAGENTAEDAIEESKAEENTTEKPAETPEKNDGSNKQENLILSMSESDRRDANVFFSNFSEAFFGEYSKDDTDAYSLINFAYIHNLINSYSEIKIRNDRYGISYETVNKTLDKYLGVSVPPKTATANNNGFELTWTYEDGFFWEPAADGESYDYFSVVNDMHDMGNGMLEATYDVYYAGYDELTKECYSYTKEEAEKNCEYSYSATAVVKRKVYGGKKTYELISLSTNQ